jgi:hypothetical protein
MPTSRTRARSKTTTITFTRTEFLIRQLDLIVKSTTGSLSFLDVIRKGIEREWIDTVWIRGLDDTDKLVEEIEIQIDWKTHRLEIEGGRGVVALDPSVPERDRISEVIGVIIDQFNQIKHRGGLKPQWAVSYAKDADESYETIQRELGLTTAPKYKWAGRRETVVSRQGFTALPEFGISYDVAVDDKK